MSSHDAHYGGNLVDGARMLGLFGDVATELCILHDGDEGLFRAYDSVEFLAPVHAGDFIEAEGEIIEVGRTSRKMRFEARKVIRPAARGLGLRGRGARAADRGLPRDRDLRRAARQAAGEAVSAAPPYVITAAMVGAETTREQTPHLPITAEEIAEDAARCREAGVAMVHLHVRRPDGSPSQDAELFRAAIRAIRARCDVLIQTSTGGAVGMSVDERCGPLTLTGADRPDMATLTTGTVNFGDDVFQQPAAAGEGDRPAHPRARHPPGDRVLRRGDDRAGRVARAGRAWSTSRPTTTSCSASPARWEPPSPRWTSSSARFRPGAPGRWPGWGATSSRWPSSPR